MLTVKDSTLKFQYFIVLAVLGYRLNDCLTKMLVTDMGVFGILFFRSIFTLTLLPLFMWTSKINYRCFFERSIFIRNLLAAVALYFEVASLEYLSLSAFILLTYMAPVFTKIFAHFILKEKISYFEVSLMALSFVGVFFILDVSIERENFLGAVYALVGAVFYALCLVFTKKMKEEAPTSIYFSYVMVLMLMSLISIPDTLPQIPEVGILFAMALIHIGVFLLHLKGLLYLQTSRAVLLEYLGLIFALSFDYLFWNRLLDPMQAMGGTCIVISCLLSIYREQILSLLQRMGISFGNNRTSAVSQPNEE